MKLMYNGKVIGSIETNHSMSVDDCISLLEIDIDHDDLDYELFSMEYSELVTVAKINSNDDLNQPEIFFNINADTFVITASNNEEVDYSNQANSFDEAQKIINAQWGSWNTFEWIEQD